MDETERLELRRTVADFRSRAILARSEAVTPGQEPWRTALLNDSADYYDRRADEAEDQLLAAQTPDTASITAAS